MSLKKEVETDTTYPVSEIDNNFLGLALLFVTGLFAFDVLYAFVCSQHGC